MLTDNIPIYIDKLLREYVSVVSELNWELAGWEMNSSLYKRV